jgi:hypothetical protein
MTEITPLTQLGDPAGAAVCTDGVCVVPQPVQAEANQDETGADK